ncbi:hypothetical protein ACJJTC_017250, partial [Scirpophaga incertulas]
AHAHAHAAAAAASAYDASKSAYYQQAAAAYPAAAPPQPQPAYDATAKPAYSAPATYAQDAEPEVQPVGQDYIEELRGDDGKALSFNCKLCDCKFNDPNAKEMHMKGRRHRLQYKKKVQPDLEVKVKPSMHQRKLAEAKAQRMMVRDEIWARRRMHDVSLPAFLFICLARYNTGDPISEDMYQNGLEGLCDYFD